MHDFDPNYLLFEEESGRLYACTLAQVECAVDHDDYLFFSQWLWYAFQDKGKNRKPYFRRLEGPRHARRTIYLHREIMARAAQQPSEKHVMVDHINGNTLDNRRCNLRWATSSENNTGQQRQLTNRTACA